MKIFTKHMHPTVNCRYFQRCEWDDGCNFFSEYRFFDGNCCKACTLLFVSRTEWEEQQDRDWSNVRMNFVNSKYTYTGSASWIVNFCITFFSSRWMKDVVLPSYVIPLSFNCHFPLAESGNRKSVACFSVWRLILTMRSYNSSFLLLA